ncbi:hypothetical protein EYF80_006650 [Liparis tanakae]|uniref:Uncharacterized protein n=1 Tax=Liparis tanakae TaxID=230148 RepID=A0A4Z2J0Q8_9TELE|nr:hypothetical protein EYF80_006650 [Liparis tanakae]
MLVHEHHRVEPSVPQPASDKHPSLESVSDREPRAYRQPAEQLRIITDGSAGLLDQRTTFPKIYRGKRAVDDNKTLVGSPFWPERVHLERSHVVINAEGE